MQAEFYSKIEQIIQRDSRYNLDAYEFIMQALWFTQRKLSRQGHVSGKELLEGIRDFAIEQYGPMARAVFSHWGIHSTDDFGEIVFNMVETGLLGSTEQDSRQDFKSGYDFNRAFDVFKPNR